MKYRCRAQVMGPLDTDFSSHIEFDFDFEGEDSPIAEARRRAALWGREVYRMEVTLARPALQLDVDELALLRKLAVEEAERWAKADPPGLTGLLCKAKGAACLDLAEKLKQETYRRFTTYDKEGPLT